MATLLQKSQEILNEKNTKILPGNIKSGVQVFDVEGTLVELQGETKSITPTTSAQTITPSSGKNGITQVSVAAVTNSIDANISAGNIKKDVTILGVTGTLEEGVMTQAEYDECNSIAEDILGNSNDGVGEIGTKD